MLNNDHCMFTWYFPFFFFFCCQSVSIRCSECVSLLMGKKDFVGTRQPRKQTKMLCADQEKVVLLQL